MTNDAYVPGDDDQDEPAGEKWVYQKTPVKKKAEYTAGQFARDVVVHVFMFGVFTLIPVLVYVAFSWLVFNFLADTFYNEPWVRPATFLFSTFLAGVLCRQLMEEPPKGLGLFIMGILGMIAFACITAIDIQNTGEIYSRNLPDILAPSHMPYVFSAPFAGMMGMLMFKYFSLQHYD
ncbi:MAG: hypothetical protein AB7P76_05795 [Candidatus Melainabacteria bacterium]